MARAFTLRFVSSNRLASSFGPNQFEIALRLLACVHMTAKSIAKAKRSRNGQNKGGIYINFLEIYGFINLNICISHTISAAYDYLHTAAGYGLYLLYPGHSLTVFDGTGLISKLLCPSFQPYHP